MRVMYVGEKKDFALKNKIYSELLNDIFTPSNYFIDFLECVE